MLGLEDVQISPEKFNDWFETAAKFAQYCADGSGEQITPHLSIQQKDINGKDGLTLCALHIDFNTFEQQRMALRRIGEMHYERKEMPQAIFLHSEAWMSDHKGIEPRLAPNKREVLIVTGCDITQKLHRLICWPLIRDGKKIVTLGPREERPDGTAGILPAFFDGFFRIPMQNMRG